MTGKPEVTVTEDDQRRAQDAALSVRPLLASKFLGIDCPLVEAIAHALAETRERAANAEFVIRVEMLQRANARIAELEAENARLRCKISSNWKASSTQKTPICPTSPRSGTKRGDPAS